MSLAHRIFLTCPAVVALCLGCALAAESADTPATLRQAAGGRVLIGTAIMSQDLDDPRHARLIAEHFGCITPGNEMKPDALQNVKGVFTFEAAEKIVAFAEAHGQAVIGHTLLWHHQAPRWLFEDEQGNPLPREQALENLRSHIHTVVGHFKGRIKGWDVVNEAIDDGGPYLRDTPARRAIGDDYIIKAFQFAHEADPDVELYYNDYNIERDYKRDKVLRLVRELKEAGVRLDAVGIQGHWLLDSPDLDEIERGMRAYLDEGVAVMFTEVDVDPLPRRDAGADLSATEREGLDPYQDGLPDDVQRRLTERYDALFRLMLGHPQVTRITLWGTTDGHSWLNSWPVRGRTNHPLLFDRDYKPKPAFDRAVQSLRDAAAASAGDD